MDTSPSYKNGATQKIPVELQLSYLSCTSVQFTYVKFLERTFLYYMGVM